MVVSLSSLGQILLKGGVSTIELKGGFGSLLSFGIDCVRNYAIVLGLVCYALGTFLWLMVLKLLDLSVAYPMISLTYPVVVFLSFLVFGEPVTLRQMIGIVAIIIGVSLVYR